MQYFQLETVRKNMTRSVRAVAPELSLSDLLRLFSSNDFEAYPVVRDGKLLGMVSKADSIQPFDKACSTNTLDFNAIMGTTVEEIMSSPAMTVEPDTKLAEIVHLMGILDFESFPVVDHEAKLMGIVAREDIIRALARCAWRSSLPLPLEPMGYAIA
jgi:CBS-domain-containing membrane protein